MRLTVFLIVFSVTTVIANTGHSQETKLTVQLKNVPLGEILNTIEDNTPYYFMFNNELIDLSERIDFDVQNKTIDEILSLLSEKTGIKHKVYDRQIVLSPGNLAVGDFSVSQQSLTISGKVTDSSGGPLPGVTVVVKSTTQGTITDPNGNYYISDVPSNATLIFSFVGMATQEIKVVGKTSIDIEMEEDAIGIDEVVAVGYGNLKKASLTGAISNIKSDEIVKTKSPSLAVALAGKVPGVQIKQQNGMPGEFNTDINIRGLGTPLFVIDGVVRDGSREFQLLNPEDIESITILKDASAAIYGMNSGNGVIIVKTKSGVSGKLNLTYNGSVGISSPTSDIPTLNVSQYYELVNEASINVGNGPAYSEEELERLQSQPTINWYDNVFKKNALNHNHNISITGGTDNISTFIGLGHSFEDGILKSGDINYKKYSLRSNTEVKVTKNLLANINISGWTDKRTQPGTDGNAFMYLLKFVYNIRPYETVYANDNTDYYNKPTPSNENPVAASNSDLFGHTDWRNSNFQSTFDLSYTVPFIKGLQLKALMAYDAMSSTTSMVQKSIKLYNYSESEGYVSSTLWQPFISEGKSTSNRLDFQGQIKYNRQFSTNHNLDATFVFESKEENSRYLYAKRVYDFFTTESIDLAPTDGQTNAGNNSKRRYLSTVGRINYNYAQKYLLELAFRCDGSYRYNPKNRWGFFPVISGGWRISEEEFVKNNFDFISNLKLRASYGKTGQDGGEPFQYMTGYNLTGGYVLEDGKFTNGWEASSLANEDLTWYTSRMLDLGVDLSVEDGLIGLELDLYRRNRSGLLGTRLQALPNTFGASLPEENLNKDRTEGIEALISHRNKIGEVKYKFSANVNFSRTKTIYEETAPYTSSWDQYRNGTVDRWQDIIWLKNVIGRYSNYEQIAESAINSTSVGNSFLLPGDYIYEDVNGDGLIDDNDVQPLKWGGTPKLYYGATISIWWKNLDVNLLLQGSALSSVKYSEVLGQVLTFNGNSPAFYYDRWHQENPYDSDSEWISGYWPATRQGTTNTYNQTDENTFNRKNTTYLRLKSVELGYTFGSGWLKRVGIKNCRIYLNGFNLLTFCDDYLKYFDPEISENGGLGYQYPLTRSYNLGVNVTF